eukprot:gb/GFBE01050007.1/.p1 GENE.gb/GFBE01050007.1/~~gb/GFBE01050007.1/.p1  ORF type:complete len:285 (+),score=94.42 gb/GFBE01050007.1/:1-855(+)
MAFNAAFVALLVALQLTTAEAGNPCEAEISTACPDRPGSEMARCLKDKSEHDSPTDISSECADFIALNVACKDDIVKFCDEGFFGDDTTLCLSTWTSEHDLSPKCANVLEWAVPKKDTESDDGPTDELGMSAKDYAEKQEWQAKRKASRGAAVEKLRQDAKYEKELAALKKEDPAAYEQLLKERAEAEASLQELKKRKRLMAAAEERKRREENGEIIDEEAEKEAEKENRKQRRLEKIREARKKDQVNWLPYVLGGLFVAFVFFNLLNFLGIGQKKEDDEDKDD